MLTCETRASPGGQAAELGETVERLTGEAKQLAAEKADLEDKAEKLEAAKGALNKQLYADVCRRMLTYADVC
jgi:predicted RNase H-like nuclease (RuvC/YqgF family)